MTTGESLERLEALVLGGDAAAAPTLEREARRRGERRALMIALASQPGERSWVQLCDLLEGADEHEVARVAPLLERWPDEVRTLPAHWGARLLDGQAAWPGVSLVREVAVSRVPPGFAWDRVWLPPLLSCEALRSLTGLVVSAHALSKPALDAVVAAPFLRTTLRRLAVSDGNILPVLDACGPNQLETLELTRCELVGAQVERLACHPATASLTKLSARLSEVGPRGAQALASCGSSTLRELDLGDNPLGVDGARALGEGLASVVRLRLRSSSIGDDAGACALAAGGGLASLEHLELSSGRLGADGARGLLVPGSMPALRSLDLSRNRIDPGGASALAEALGERSLELLELDTNAIGPTGIQALAAGAALRSVYRLGLSSNALGDEGARWLARSEHLGALRELVLHCNGLGGDALRALGAAGWFAGLRKLVLSDNALGDEGASVLAATRVHGLNHLDLGHCALGDDGVCALAASPVLEHVESLDLRSNVIGERGVLALAASPHVGRLRRLDLSYNHTPGSAAAALVRAQRLPALRELVLTRNAIDDDGARAMADAVGLGPELERLDLRVNPIHAAGASALAGAFESSSQLIDLQLTEVTLGPEGVAVMVGARGLPMSVRWRYGSALRPEGLRRCLSAIGRLGSDDTLSKVGALALLISP